MKIQVNTDAHINGTEALAERVTDMVEQALKHYRGHVTRVEVHLSDENAGKGGSQDQRCLLEARLEGRQPLAVTENAPTMAQAVSGAAQKLRRSLDSTLGRLQQHRVDKDRAAGEPSAPEADAATR